MRKHNSIFYLSANINYTFFFSLYIKTFEFFEFTFGEREREA